MEYIVYLIGLDYDWNKYNNWAIGG